MRHFSTNSLFVRNQNLFFSKIDDEIVMMDENQGRYFGLNSVAADIWEILENQLSYQAIINFILKRYYVDEARCQQEIADFLNTMIEQQLIFMHN